MPEDFEWDDVDLDVPTDVEEARELLEEAGFRIPKGAEKKASKRWEKAYRAFKARDEDEEYEEEEEDD